MTTKPSEQFQLSPGPGIKATVTVDSPATLTYIDPTTGQQVTGTSVSVGTTGDTTTGAGSAIQFTAANVGGYISGYVSVDYGTSGDSASCNINFNIGASTAPWTVSASPTNADILNYNSDTPTNMAVSVPNTVPSGIAANCQPFDKSMTFMVDQDTTSTNILFRGNCPLAAPSKSRGPQAIDFTTVHAILAERYNEETGGTFPDIGDYVFCDVNLQSPTSEALYLQYELESVGGGSDISILDSQKWSKSGTTTPPDLTKVYKDPTTGMLCCMVNYSIEPSATLGSSSDNFDQGCAKNLTTWMGKDSTKPYVYYIHCASGHDRTGIVASTYLMQKYPTMSLDESFIRGTTVHKLNGGTGQLKPNCTYLNGPDEGKTSSKFSRVTLIADNYNETVENIYNTLRSTKESLSTQATTAVVYDNYPWS